MLPTNFLLLDAARMGNIIDEARKMNRLHDSLYRGRSEETLDGVAPYIFTFNANNPFGKWYFDKGWGDAWGMLVHSAYTINDLHKHFRKFLLVQTEDKEELYFRFYDPRVLRIFLPTCDTSQLKEFFGPINYFITESEDAAFATKFWLENYQLKSEQIPKENLESIAQIVTHNVEVDANPTIEINTRQDNINIKPNRGNNSFNIFMD